MRDVDMIVVLAVRSRWPARRRIIDMPGKRKGSSPVGRKSPVLWETATDDGMAGEKLGA